MTEGKDEYYALVSRPDAGVHEEVVFMEDIHDHVMASLRRVGSLTGASRLEIVEPSDEAPGYTVFIRTTPELTNKFLEARPYQFPSALVANCRRVFEAIQPFVISGSLMLYPSETMAIAMYANRNMIRFGIRHSLSWGLVMVPEVPFAAYRRASQTKNSYAFATARRNLGVWGWHLLDCKWYDANEDAPPYLQVVHMPDIMPHDPIELLLKKAADLSIGWNISCYLGSPTVRRVAAMLGALLYRTETVW